MKASKYDRRLIAELLILLIVFGMGFMTGSLDATNVAVAAEDLATSGATHSNIQPPKFSLFGEELCKELKPTGAAKVIVCFQQYRNDSDPKRCVWIGTLDYATPNQTHGQVTGLVQYEEDGKPLCLGNQSDVAPLFVSHGSEYSINSGPPKGAYFLVKNSKDSCLWIMQRDLQVPSRVVSLAPYKVNGKTVCNSN
jgi:hypothetical protein